jgi:CheY-like chemotaxis protein
MSNSRSVVLLCVDLMMTSTVSSAAAQCGLKFRTLATADQLSECADEDMILIDLATPGLNIQQAAAALNDRQKQAAIIYGPHVHTERFEQAREAGFEHLLARGRFSAEADQIVNDFAAAGRAS